MAQNDEWEGLCKSSRRSTPKNLTDTEVRVLDTRLKEKYEEDPSWENLCNRCLDCCDLFQCGVACPVLDLKKHCCSDYENRHQRNPNCTKLTPDNVLFLHEHGVLSDRCNYVRHMKGQELVWDVEPRQLESFEQQPEAFKMYYKATRRD